MRGQCLCGAVEFEVIDPPTKIYQCHCSLCRKQSGAACNAAFIVRQDRLVWHAGQALVSSYTKPSGFRSDFCSRCGSPVPNRVRDTSYVWIPVGLLDGSAPFEIAMHLHVGSKAAWEPAPSGGAVYQHAPEPAEFFKALR